MSDGFSATLRTPNWSSRRAACFGWIPALDPVSKKILSPRCWKLRITKIIVSR